MGNPDLESAVVENSGQPRIISAADTIRYVREHGAGNLIDIRTPAEVSAQRIEGARCISLEQLVSRIDEVRAVEGQRLLLCRTGRRAELAREKLAGAGVDDLLVVSGGIVAYAAAGGEVVVDHQRMSLERQVRIAAGSLVVIGTVLGFTVHPALYGISAFVGAGLVFAGLTDSCGMGLILAKMPWNRA